MEIKRFKEVPDTIFEYYQGVKVLVKTTDLGVNTLIQVWKPGTYEYWNEYTKNPVAMISMNGTGLVDKDTFKRLQKMLEIAVKILNNEGDGIIKLENLSINFQDTVKNKAQYKASAQASKHTKYIRQADLVVGHIYEELNGRKTLYLGNSHLYKDRVSQSLSECSLDHSNRTNYGTDFATNIYGDQDTIDVLSRGYTFGIMEIAPGIKIFTVTPTTDDDDPIGAGLDSYVSNRKFVRDLGALLNVPRDCRVIVFYRPKDTKQTRWISPLDSVIVVRDVKDRYIPGSVSHNPIRYSVINNDLKFDVEAIKKALLR